MRIPLLIVGVFLTLSGTPQAGPPGSGFSGGGFHGRFSGGGFHGGFGAGGFHGRFVAHNAGSAFRMQAGFHHNFAHRRFFAHNRFIFFQQFAYPFYWYPYYDPLAYSYLEPDSDYQYWDNSARSVQPESFGRAADRNPVVVVINTGNSHAMDSSPNTVDSGQLSTSSVGQQRMVVQDANEKTESGTDPMKPVAPAVPQATPAAQNAFLQTQPGVFGKLVIVSWSEEGGKDVIFVKNIETNDVQQITSQPNIDNFRLVEIHPNADLRQFEAIISNGSEQGAVRFLF